MLVTTVLVVVALAIQGSPPVADVRGIKGQANRLSVTGDARLSAAQLEGWYATTGRTARLANGLTVGNLARLYVQEGNAEHVRGDVAFAQAILETGYFTFPRAGQARPTDNNFAGLGACDACTTAAHFPTAQGGVRAQIQLLRNYADTGRATTLADTPSPSAPGPDTIPTASAIDQVGPGSPVRTWENLGNGRWASAPNYGTTILTIYRAMLSYAAADRSGT